MVMQRLFSMFPVGLPGVGLLCLRLATTLSVCLMMPWLQTRIPAIEWALEIVGFLLVIGFATPVLALFCSLIGLYGMIDSGGTAWGSLASPMLVACALTFLGPGAYSVDARLFGRRSVVINSPGDAPGRGY